MPKRDNSEKHTQADQDFLKSRLDAIIYILVHSNFSDENGRIKITEVAPMLHAAGFTPTEIAQFFGKKKASEVAPYLYSRKKK